MPCLKRLLKAMRLVRDRVSFDPVTERWTITVSAKEMGNIASGSTDTDELIKSVQRLESKLDRLTGAYTELSHQMEAVSQRLVSSAVGAEEVGVTAGLPHAAMMAAIGKRAGPSFYSTVMAMRERPFSAKGSTK